MLRMVARLSVMAVTTPSQGPRDEGDVGGLDGDVGAGADGEADVGLGEGGCVVDAVADHGDDTAFVLEAAHLEGLVLGEHLGEDPFDADLAGDRGGGAGVVAGDHRHLDARVPEARRSRRRSPP